MPPQSRPSADAVHSYGSVTGSSKDSKLRTCGGVFGAGKKGENMREGHWRQRKGTRICSDFPNLQYCTGWEELLYFMKVENPFLDFSDDKSYSPKE